MTANIDTLATIGRYQLIAEIGKGGMSTVYLAIMRGMAGFDKLLVVKVLREVGTQPEEMAQFMSEAQLAARLNHPNVVQSHEVGEDEGRFFIAMEYLEGQPLSRVGRASTAGALPLPLHLRVLSDVLAGLQYAHDLADYDGRTLGIVHRDVSPQNVFITYDGVVKLLDFGIAKSTTTDQQETRTGIIKGKIGYLAPEQLTSGGVTQRVDIFAVGLMLWEAITGRRAWEGLTEYDILLRLSRRELPSLREVRPDAPEALIEICERALQPDPEKRFATALDFRMALEEYLGSFSSRANGAALAQYMSQRYNDERTRLRSLVKQRLAAFEAAGATSSSTMGVTLPTLSGIRAEATLSQRLLKHTTSSRYALSSENTGALVEKSPSATRHWVLAVGTVAAVASVAFFAQRHAGQPAHAAASPIPASAVTLLPDAPPTPIEPREGQPTVEVRLSASPPEARMFIDNAPLPTNPYLGKFAKSDLTHHLRIEASGYQSRTELVTFESDRMISVELSRPNSPTVVPARRTHPARPPISITPIRPHAGSDSPLLLEPPAPPPSPAKPAVAGDRPRELDESIPMRSSKPLDEINPYR